MTNQQLLQYAYIGISETIIRETEKAKGNYHPEVAQKHLALAELHLKELTELMRKVHEKSQAK